MVHSYNALIPIVIYYYFFLFRGKGNSIFILIVCSSLFSLVTEAWCAADRSPLAASVSRRHSSKQINTQQRAFVCGGDGGGGNVVPLSVAVGGGGKTLRYFVLKESVIKFYERHQDLHKMCVVTVSAASVFSFIYLPSRISCIFIGGLPSHSFFGVNE